jgi:YdjC-like protein
MKYGHVIDARRDGKRRHIWLCADDYGMSPAVNVAIRDLVVRGRINATSVMVVAPNFYRSEAVSLNILNASETRVAIGLHVTLTAPYQPLSATFNRCVMEYSSQSERQPGTPSCICSSAKCWRAKSRVNCRSSLPHLVACPISLMAISTCTYFHKFARHCSVW